MQRSNRPYELTQYDPVWAEVFTIEAARIKEALDGIATSVEHIGSTAIPGMVAKSQVDILVVVPDLDLVPPRYAALTAIGYTPQGREYVGSGQDEYCTKDSEDGHRLVSVHILQEGNPRIAGYIHFRDYIRQHADERALYIQIKTDLYTKYPNDYTAYDREKDLLMSPLKARAQKWGVKNLQS